MITEIMSRLQWYIRQEDKRKEEKAKKAKTWVVLPVILWRIIRKYDPFLLIFLYLQRHYFRNVAIWHHFGCIGATIIISLSGAFVLVLHCICRNLTIKFCVWANRIRCIGATFSRILELILQDFILGFHCKPL